MSSSSQHLPEQLRDPAFQARVVRALLRTYEVSQERHDLGVGDDLMTFGIHVWKSGAFFLGPAIVTSGGTAEVLNQSLALRIADVEMRHHKLGDSELDNPRTCFPHHAGPAARMIGRATTEQLELELPKNEAEAGRVYLDWVIGSYGNPEDGLRAVRFQAVGSQRALDGTISRWEAVETIFDASAGTIIMPIDNITENNDSNVPNMEITPEPDVELRNDNAAGDSALSS